MDVSSRAFRELKRHTEKVRKIIHDSPISHSLLEAQDDLVRCIESLENKTRTLLLLAESDEDITLLRNLLDTNGINDLQLKVTSKVTSKVASPFVGQSPPEVFLTFQNPQLELVNLRLDFESRTSFVIGRNEEKSNLLIDRNMTLISGVHAEIRLGPNSELSLRDLGSLNGTFVNQAKCQPNKWIDISRKDQVIFGWANSIPGTCTLLFATDRQDVQRESAEQTYSLGVITGLLLLPTDDVETAIQYVETTLASSSVATLIVLLNRSRFKSTEKQLSMLGSKLPSISSSVHFFPIYLAPYTLNDGSTLVIPEAQKEYESLITQIQSSYEEPLILSALANSLRRLVGNICQRYELAIKANMSETRCDISSSMSGSDRQSQAPSSKPSYELIARYEALIQRLKSSLAIKKEEFLDDYSVQSVTRSIDQEMSALSLSRKQKDGLIRISLEPPVTSDSAESVHKHMLSFCHNLLSEWSNSALETIVDSTDGSDSISRLYHEGSQASQEDDQSTTYSKSTTQPELLLDINKILNARIAPPITFTLIRFPGFLGYIFKNLRGQIMSVGGTIIIVGGMLTTQIQNGLKEVVLPALLPVIGVLTWLAYCREINQKSDESIEKLRKDVRTYYVAYTKSRLEKVTSALIDVLKQDKELFERRFISPLKKVTAHNEAPAVNHEPATEPGNSCRDLSRAALSKMNRQLENLNMLIIELDQYSESPRRNSLIDL